MIEQFHFLRPWWLLALPALAWLVWQYRRSGLDSGNWRRVVDARLLPHLLASTADSGRDQLLWLLSAVAALAILALAGPTWEKQMQSTYQQPSALVIALDLSRSMNATDIRPSRLARARHKIADVLDARRDGQTALVVYAADAFAVTPLTSDTATILALLPDLDTGLMPAQGSRADRAFERALELFENSGVAHGDLLLVSDGFGGAEIEYLESLLEQHNGHRVSVLASGTAEGGPVPMSKGGFLKSRDGDIVIAATNSAEMQEVAERGSGVFSLLRADDSDVNLLTGLMLNSADEREAVRSEQSAQQWRELGPLLILLALPFAALVFRRGLLWMFPLAMLLSPPEVQAVDWQVLWNNNDQRALQLFDEGEHAAAAKLFGDEDWQASANYRAGEFATAAAQWQKLDSEAARYNHANALAQQGQYEQALAAYDDLLQRNPAHADAIFNRQAIADWLEQQQQNSQDQSPQQSDDEQSEQGGGEQSRAQNDASQAGDEDASESGNQSGQDGQSQADSGLPDQRQSESQQGEQSQQEQQRSQTTADSQQAGDTDTAMSDPDQQMSQQAAEQWLRQIPDDPGGLLRRKFVYQYRNRGGVDAEEQTW